METVNLIIFGGQSNMQGQTDEPNERPEAPGALEYKMLTDALVPLCDPVGEDITYGGTAGWAETKTSDGAKWLSEHALGSVCFGNASMVPAFMRTYQALTNHKAVAVHAAKGSTVIAQWLPGAPEFEMLCKKAGMAKEKIQKDYAIGKIFFVFLQGESDALAGTSQAEYEKMITAMKDGLKKELGIDKFGIIRVGLFAMDARDRAIMNAQEAVCRNDADFLMLTRSTERLFAQKSMMNPEYHGHFGTKGLATLGEEVAEALASFETRTKRLFRDEHFREGFRITARRHGRGGRDVIIDTFRFPFSREETPVWLFEQWHSRHCIRKERTLTNNPYGFENTAKAVYMDKDTGIISLRLNARNEYEGRPHKDKRVLWPHLLLEQNMAEKFEDFSPEEKPFYSADFKKLELDTTLRFTDYKNTSNPEGINACQFMAYFYLTMKDNSGFIYFGVNFFDNRGDLGTYWRMDVEGRAMIFLLSTGETFGTYENGFNLPDGEMKLNEWKTVRLDLTPYIDKLIGKINEDNVFGRTVSREDFYVRGTNIGFEIHGNFDCTVELKDYNLISTI